jgi:hypothetical protein
MTAPVSTAVPHLGAAGPEVARDLVARDPLIDLRDQQGQEPR